MQTPRLTVVAGLWLASSLVVPAVTQTPAASSTPPAKPAAEPAMQLPADQRAYEAARAIVDQEQREKALQAFLKEYPESKQAEPARRLLLKALLENAAANEREVHDLARVMVDHAAKGQRAAEENEVAYYLAEALPNGVDLKAAEAWAKDSVELTTLASMTAMMKESAAKYKVPMPPEAKIHEYWASEKAGRLQTLAEVYFHEGKLAEASATVEEAQPLDPTEGGIWLTRGEIAHARHQDAEALEDLEMAAVYGGVTPATQPLLRELYAGQHHGDGSGLEAEIDKRYMALEKPLPAPAHAAPPTGRTVLMELFTGSGCSPCVAADLGMDGVLRAYPRSEVVALSFDQHIPEPDPLANKDTVARFDYHDGGGTPTAVIDGVPLTGIGGDREDGKNAFETLGKAIDADLATPSGVTLQLRATLTPSGTVSSVADVSVGDPNALGKWLAATAKADAAESPAKGGSAPTAGSPKLVLNFALVQRQVRYSGENGIRFHSMVVRSLAKPSLEGFPVASDGRSSASFRFDPSAVSASLHDYLEAFARHSDRFGTTHFLMTDTTLPMDQLAVAAWVEDPATHKVVAAAFAPVDAAVQKASR